MKLFDRQYRLEIGRAGAQGFEIGATSAWRPVATHVSFVVNKADTETPNTAKISLWNLGPEQLAALKTSDCTVALRAGYGAHMPLLFVGCVTYMEITADGADRKTTIEAVDGRAELRDGFVSLSYSGAVSTKKVLEDIAAAMGVAVAFSHNAAFADLPKFVFVGAARVALDKACSAGSLQWSIQNGILQISVRGCAMTREVYVLSPDSGLVGIPKQFVYGKSDKGAENQSGYEVEYLMNGAIGVGDYVRLESNEATGYHRVRAVEICGDNIEGDWLCAAKLVET